MTRRWLWLLLSLMHGAAAQTPISLRCTFLAEDMTPLVRQPVNAEIVAAPPLLGMRMSTQATTNEMGEFLILLPDATRPYWVLVGIPGAAFFVDASRPQRLPPSLKCWLGDKPSAVCTVTGDASKVALFLRLSGTTWWLRLPPFKEGQLTLFRLPVGQHQVVLAPASLPMFWDGVQPLQAALLEIMEGATARLRFQVPPLGSVSGVVMTPQERPIPRAIVTLDRDGAIAVNAVTDAQGRFSLDGVPEGSYRVIVSAHDYETFTTVIRVHPDQETTIAVSLKPEPLGLLRGRVVSKGEASLQNGRLWIERVTTLNLRQPISVWALQPDGRFEGKLREGIYRITVQVGGRRATKEVRIVANQTTDLGEWLLPLPAIVEGMVKGDMPASGLRLRIVALKEASDPLQPQWGNLIGEVVVPSDGRFRVEVPPEPVALVLLLPGGGRPLVRQVHARLGQRLFVEFVLPRFGSIEGQVVRADIGRPVPGAIVTLIDETGVPTAQTMTNPFGFYQFHAVMPGRYSLRCQGQGLAMSVRHEVRVGAGMKVPVDFVLTPGGSIVGEVRASKTPLNRLYVMVNADTNLVGSVAPNGRFRVDFIPPGRHIVMLFRLGEQIAVKEVVVESGKESEVAFDLP